MTNFLKALGLVVVGAVVGALVAVPFSASRVATGGVYSQSEQSFGEGAAFGTSRQTTISSAGVITSSAANTFSGAQTFSADQTFGGGDGAIVVTTSNTATSSITVGCINTYASSTATAMRLRFIATATTIYPYTGLAVLPQYGTCP